MSQQMKNIPTINNLKTYPVHTILSRPTNQNCDRSSTTGQELTQNESQLKSTSGQKFTSSTPQPSAQFGPRMPNLRTGSPMLPKLAPIDDDEDFDLDFPTLSLGSNDISETNSRKSEDSPLDFTFSHGSALVDTNSQKKSTTSSKTTQEALDALKSGGFVIDNAKLTELQSRLTTTQRMVNPTEADCQALLNLAKTDPKRVMAERIIDQSRMHRRFAVAKKMLAMIEQNTTESQSRYGAPRFDMPVRRVK